MLFMKSSSMFYYGGVLAPFLYWWQFRRKAVERVPEQTLPKAVAMNSRLLVFLLILLCFFPGTTKADEKPQTRVRISGSIMREKLIEHSPPAYPAEAAQKHIEGVVSLEILVGTDGTVLQIEALSGPKLLTPAAMESVRHWRYEVTKVKGESVEVVTRVDVIFKLPK
jgi:TonB family protein